MAKKFEVFKCSKGMTFEMITEGDCGDITCCGQPVELLKEKTTDMGKEKHVPLVRQEKAGVRIVVGATPHPMTPEHHIQWIEIINGNYVCRKYLKPDEAPEAEFSVCGKELIVRSYCNLHGLWRG